MIQFSADVMGVEVLSRAFNRIEKEISDLRSVWPGVAEEFYAIELSQFASQGAKGASGKWDALSLAYAKFKAKAFPGQPILRATDSLYESMTSPDALDSIFRMEPQQMTIGTQREGATAHQKTRPIISFTNDDKRRITKSIQAGLVKFTRQAGFEVQG